jgi:TolB-like protein/DNA-binding winged helix-turn-helix (wHTH) protein/tetratricopeptide (TPR) repeat protein
MAHPATSLGHYQFGVYTVDLRACELRKHGVRIKVQERPLQVLLVLLERPGEVVTRDELKRRLWAEGTFVDFDHGISSAVNKLRAALNDSAQHPVYVETLGRQGYRFIYPVAPHLSPLRVVEDRSATPADSKVIELAPARARVIRWMAAVITALVVVSAIASALLLRNRNAAPPDTAIRSLAVLPLQNLSSDPEQEYFSEGLTEELTARLASLEGVRVISRTSAMQYKGSNKPLPEIARELHVDAIIEGSVLRVGSRVRITAQLIHAADDRHIWAESYERDQSDVLAMQDAVARAIADSIKVTLAGPQGQLAAAAAPVDSAAHEAYLRGRFYLAKRTVGDLDTAVGYFQQAVARDPHYALAFAGLADGNALLSVYTYQEESNYIEKARAAAHQALELDPRLAEAHTALAVIAQNYDLDWQTAETEYREAIRLDPNYATAHHWYAEMLSFQGRFPEAYTEIDRAEQLDPLSLIMQTDHGAILFYDRKYDAAEEKLRGVIARDPTFGRAHGLLQNVLEEQGKGREAMADVESLHWVKDDVWRLIALTRTAALAGDRARAQMALARLEQVTRAYHIDSGPLVYAYAAVGKKDKAFAALEQAFQQHSPVLTSLKVNPQDDPLRGDPRYDDFLRRAHLK